MSTAPVVEILRDGNCMCATTSLDLQKGESEFVQIETAELARTAASGLAFRRSISSSRD